MCFREIRYVRRPYVSFAVLAVDPTGVQEPDVCLVFVDLLLEHFRVQSRVSGKEDLAETGGEGRRGGVVAGDDACHVGRVAADEVVHGLHRVELGDWRQHSVGVAGQEDDVLGMASHGWDLGTGNIFQGV